MTSFDHVHLCCTDLDAMIAFWTKAFGAEFVRFRKFGGADGAVVTLTGVQIFLKKISADSSMPDGSACGINHIGVRVDDPNVMAETLVNEFGCKLINKASDNCSFVAGPQGVTFELMRVGAEV
ncbi:VOC family protein [uncultured Mailhella sp.]|uniref:VOC family protein n=1 Tax=uncultured Mailhella sp. TaxID=1981031 RepID=UPI003209F1DA